jgi:DNA-binding HxlR family transcriptional regulator
VRSYGQYCAVAKALDVVGDRWTLLIVRELLLRGPCRYTDLRNGLPGIATNLLADRLRELERVGIVRSEAAPPPVATTLFRLTPRGEQLEPVLHELGRWGGPLLAEPGTGDAFCTHWLGLPAQLHLAHRTPGAPPLTIELRTGDQPLTIETVDGAVRTRPGPAEDPDVVLTGAPELIVGLLIGRLDVAEAGARGLQCEGDLEALRRVISEGGVAEHVGVELAGHEVPAARIDA